MSRRAVAAGRCGTTTVAMRASGSSCVNPAAPWRDPHHLSHLTPLDFFPTSREHGALLSRLFSVAPAGSLEPCVATLGYGVPLFHAFHTVAASLGASAGAVLLSGV